ncbi:HigA family addiction module antitoxin [Sphingopyxis indica]|uniref:Addiction module antidote protein, HigA family n=1 Tax=Sphingopyxis indica TaxID=436663 RepID=A0A239DC38_9SPHN|nr:HigA family addiction module antitoxin [Sphingopyxis indica]SNS29434.1 addiction module antidote protein, HigA family [Sphingopyxis indica]
MTIQLHASLAVHPGPWLRRNMVEPYRLNVSQAANHLQVSRAAMSNLLNGHADLSPEMAVRFEKAFGVSAATLLRMQAAFDLAQVEDAAKTLRIERLPEPA